MTEPQGSVGIRVTTGSLRSCIRFDPPTIRRDETGRFIARATSAPALADCSDAALAGPTTTTTTSTTVPTCGDGTVQPPEQCDGTTDLADHCEADAPLAGCFPPGSPNECDCCTNGNFCDAGLGGLPCCDGACLVMGMPSFGGTTCYDPTCGPGDDCALGQDCVDGQCCLQSGTCFFEPSGDFIPCCPPAVCIPVPGGGMCG